MTVFVLEDDNKKNFISAQQYGDLRIILPFGTTMGRKTDDLMLLLDRALSDFSDEDYIIPTGDPAIMLAAGAMLGRDHNVITILKWDRQNNTYFPTTIEI